ncbi:hypothetical protein HID58_075704 [Brassica napus]|uniref:Uncharacterized protein n=1 Tax=Brassica napus TaxID=3708 RepID=A0ABQ7YKG3_BRANA|nr:hypothetical protein HID58_075704 [Brassica napus]
MNTSLHQSETPHCVLQLNLPKMYELEDNYGLSQPVATLLKTMDAISSAFSYMQMGSSGKVDDSLSWEKAFHQRTQELSPLEFPLARRRRKRIWAGSLNWASKYFS